MRVEVVRADACYIKDIAANVRKADREELWAAGCMTPLDCMFHGLEYSVKAWTGLIDGTPVCMFGCVSASILGNVGRPWMVGTKQLVRHPLVFLRRCKEYVEEMRVNFDRLENYVDVRNTKAIEWLTWLGFEFPEQPKQIGPYKMLFLRFEMRGIQ